MHDIPRFLADVRNQFGSEARIDPRQAEEGLSASIRPDVLTDENRHPVLPRVPGPSGAAVDAPLVFTEVQFQHDPDFYGRWLAEICLYLYRRQVQRPWRAVVLFPTAAEDPGPGPAFAQLAAPPQVSRYYLVPILEAAKA